MIEIEKCEFCFGTGRHKGMGDLIEPGSKCAFCGGTGQIKQVPSDLQDALRETMNQKSPEEVHGRAILVEMLENGTPLAGCLGGMIELMRMCGDDGARQMATIVDDALQAVMKKGLH